MPSPPQLRLEALQFLVPETSALLDPTLPAFNPPSQLSHFLGREAHATQDMVLEGGGGRWCDGAGHVQKDVGVGAYLKLGVGIEPELEEAEQIMQLVHQDQQLDLDAGPA